MDFNQISFFYGDFHFFLYYVMFKNMAITSKESIMRFNSILTFSINFKKIVQFFIDVNESILEITDHKG